MVQVGSQKYIRVFEFLFSYFVNQLMDDLHLSHMTKVGGKNKHTHTHTHKTVGKSFFSNKNLANFPPSPKIAKSVEFSILRKSKQKKTLPICWFL
jgi:hypothetical protein